LFVQGNAAIVPFGGKFFWKIDVCTCIFVQAMKLEEAIQSTTFFSAGQKAALNVLYTAWWLKTITNQALKPHGLTHEQYNVLRIVKGKHPHAMCIKDIAGRVIEKNSNVPRIVDRLVAKKWVKRTPGHTDKRESLIGLTTTGLGAIAAATAALETQMAPQVQLSEKEATLLNDLLERMRTG
jgi:DNA-binding MarR family transcriptional regulator